MIEESRKAVAKARGVPQERAAAGGRAEGVPLIEPDAMSFLAERMVGRVAATVGVFARHLDGLAYKAEMLNAAIEADKHLRLHRDLTLLPSFLAKHPDESSSDFRNRRRSKSRSRSPTITC